MCCRELFAWCILAVWFKLHYPSIAPHLGFRDRQFRYRRKSIGNLRVLVSNSMFACSILVLWVGVSVEGWMGCGREKGTDIYICGEWR